MIGSTSSLTSTNQMCVISNWSERRSDDKVNDVIDLDELICLQYAIRAQLVVNYHDRNCNISWFSSVNQRSSALSYLAIFMIPVLLHLFKVWLLFLIIEFRYVIGALWFLRQTFLLNIELFISFYLCNQRKIKLMTKCLVLKRLGQDNGTFTINIKHHYYATN